MRNRVANDRLQLPELAEAIRNPVHRLYSSEGSILVLLKPTLQSKQFGVVTGHGSRIETLSNTIFFTFLTYERASSHPAVMPTLEKGLSPLNVCVSEI